SVFRLSPFFRRLIAPRGLPRLCHNLQVGVRKIISDHLHLIQLQLRLNRRRCWAFWLRRKPSSPEHPCSFFPFHRCCVGLRRCQRLCLLILLRACPSARRAAEFRQQILL